ADLWKSTDSGKSWNSVTNGISGGASVWEGILTMDPGDHMRLFYGTDRVLRTTNGCATAWEEVSQALSGSVSAIAVAPSSSQRVYAGTIYGSFYRSDDGGDTSPWADRSAGLPSRSVSSIWVDPADKNVVLVSLGGTLGSGGPGTPSSQSVYRSSDG